VDEPLRRRMSPIGVMMSKNTIAMMNLVMIQFKIIANFIHTMNAGRSTDGAHIPNPPIKKPIKLEMMDTFV
jgi:hypothetical protein